MTDPTTPPNYIYEGLLTFQGPVTCDCCPGGRVYEMLDEPPAMDKFWHVCPCCGERRLLPRSGEAE